jgi:hypothetical protein
MSKAWQNAWGRLEELGASLTLVNRLQPLDEWLLVSLSGCNVGDEVLPLVKDLTALNLKIIDLGGTRVSDAAVEQFSALDGLWKLRLAGTAVSAEGAARLRQSLPNCEIAM